MYFMGVSILETGLKKDFKFIDRKNSFADRPTQFFLACFATLAKQMYFFWAYTPGVNDSLWTVFYHPAAYTHSHLMSPDMLHNKLAPSLYTHKVFFEMFEIEEAMTFPDGKVTRVLTGC